MKIFIYLPIIFLATSCTQYYYMPTMQNVPLFNNEKEIKATAGIDEHATNYQIAYSINKHIAVQCNGMHMSSEVKLLEGGVGYYNNLDKYIVFETFAGYGYGQVFDFNLKRLYVQPAIGFSSKWFDCGLSVKFANLRYNFIHPINQNNYVNSTINEPNAKLGNTVTTTLIITNTNYIFAEPCLTLRTGYKYVKLQYQIVKANMLNNLPLKHIQFNQSLSIFISLPLGWESPLNPED